MDRLIAISGMSGCGNSTVGNLCARQLQFKFINFTFRNLAAERGISLAELARQAELDDEIDRAVDSRQLELAGSGNAVLSSRLAIWLLPAASLKVYLYASAATRVKRIHQREGGDIKKLHQATAERDTRDHQRYLNLYQIDNYQFIAAADLVINTERHSAEKCAAIIVKIAESS